MSRLNKYQRNTRKKRTENNVILIVCCGKTEEKYFKEFNLDLGEIRVKAVARAKCPSQLIKYTKQSMDYGMYRQVWCVFDKDEFNDFDEAIQSGEKANIRIAFSNQAFEYWFILHYEQANRKINRRDYANILEKQFGNAYIKAADNLYAKLKDRMPLAIHNAKTIHQMFAREGGRPSTWESCTTVYKLVKELTRWKK